MRSADKLVIGLLVAGMVLASVAFAVFAFHDPIQTGFYARAEKILGVPIPWQFNFQHPFSETERDIYRFHNFLLGINIAICALVATLVMIAVYLFRAPRHPVPSRTSHNTPLEVTWTIVPVIVLLVIALWSFPLLRKVDFAPNADLTLKVTGNQ